MNIEGVVGAIIHYALVEIYVCGKGVMNYGPYGILLFRVYHHALDEILSTYLYNETFHLKAHTQKFSLYYP